MNWMSIFGGMTAFAAMGGLFFSVIKWGVGKLDKRFNDLIEYVDKRFDAIDKRFDAIDKRFDKVDSDIKEIKVEIKEIKSDINKLDRRISRIEDRLEFSNKVVYIQRDDIEEN